MEQRGRDRKMNCFTDDDDDDYNDYRAEMEEGGLGDFTEKYKIC